MSNIGNSLWIKAEAEPLRERTLKALREAIIAGHLKPGERLIERDLCEQVGVSRSSIREALRYLESERLVESRGARGTFVSVLDRKQAREIYELRHALEAEAARHFAKRATDDELAELDRAYRTIQESIGQDALVFTEAIDRFMVILMMGAHNDTAFEIMQTIRTRINFLRRATNSVASKDRLMASVEYMGALVEALRNRDGEAAALASQRFTSRSAEFADQYLKSFESFAKGDKTDT